jgi:hypothetical protein
MSQQEANASYQSMGAFPKPEPKISGLLPQKAGPSSKVINLQSPGVAEGQAVLRGENVPGRTAKPPINEGLKSEVPAVAQRKALKKALKK